MVNYFPLSRDNNCELNDANKDAEQAAMKLDQGENYYDLVRSYTVKVRESFVVDRVVLVFFFFFYLRFHHNIARTQGHLYPKGATIKNPYLSYKLGCYARISSPDKRCNKRIFLITPISCLDVTRLSRHSARLMNERQSLQDSQYKV